MKKINIPIFYYKGSRRSLSQKQKRIINSNLDKFRFKKLKKKYNKVFLDIGFGYGENMIHLAKRNLNTLILGCEIYLPGISNLLQRINNQISKCIDQKINQGYSEKDAERKCDRGY